MYQPASYSQSLSKKNLINDYNAISYDQRQQLNEDSYFLLRRLPLAAYKVLNQLLWLSQRFNKVCPSQEKIGVLCGIGRQWANRIIKRLAALGFIISVYRHRRTCEYKIAKIFFDPDFRAIAAHFFTAMNGWRRPLEYVKKVSTRDGLRGEATPLNLKVSFSLLFIKAMSNCIKQSNWMKRERLGPTVIESQSLHEEDMKQQVLRTIRSMKDFTELERHELSCYDQAVLKVAMAKTCGKALYNPFSYFKSICHMTQPASGQSPAACAVPVMQQTIHKEPTTGMNQPMNNQLAPQSAYMERPDNRTQRELEHSLFCKVFTEEGNKIRKMLNAEKLLYCYEALVPRGTSKEEIDRMFAGGEMFIAIREAKSSRADDAVSQYKQRTAVRQW